MSKKLLLVIAAAALSAAAAFAASAVGTLRSSGAVTVGGSSARAAGVPSRPVLAGERIAVGAGAAAVVESSGYGRVEIRSDSKVRFEQGQVILEHGVVATEGYGVRVGENSVEVRGVQGETPWVVVADRDGKRLVAAYRGEAIIRAAGAAPLLVPAGSYAYPTPNAAGDKKDRDKDDKDSDRRRGGTAPAGGARIGWTIGSLGHNASIALVAGIGAAATTGAVVGLTSSGDQQLVRSPSSSQ